ncbi:MAG: aldolase, partial [Betaproteobacteria bacterium]|nr:aldolase [Betaproteobacteria bacterium]
MRTNPVKQKLAAGGTALGTMVFEFSSPGLPALLSAAGAEFALYD